MTTAQLERAVASATGESCGTIRARGFTLVTPMSCAEEVDEGGLSLACPGCGREVLLTRGSCDLLPEFAECSTCDAAYPYGLHEVYERDFAEPAALG